MIKGTSIFDFAYKPYTRSINFVIKELALEADVNYLEIVGPLRKANLARVRNVLCYMLHEYAHLSYTEIAIVLNRDHTTVMTAKKKGEDFVKGNQHLNEYVEDLAARAGWKKRAGESK